MAKRPKPGTNRDEAQSIARRAEALDALDGILPFDRRDRLALVLSDDDVATLRHLANQGLGENSLRALASDLFYIEAWCLAATGTVLPWPAPEPLLLKFVAHHLWDFSRRESDAAHGMPAEVASALAAQGVLRVTKKPHAPATVRRKLSSWSTLTRWRGLTGHFNAPGLNSAIKLAVRAAGRPRLRKSQKAVTADVLAAVLQACAGDSMTDCRDRALLLFAFASGGRRRSEVAALRLEQLVEETPVLSDPQDTNGDTLPCLKIRLGRTKTTNADTDTAVFLIGRPVLALKDWISRAELVEGAVFRAIDRWGHVQRRALTPQAVNLILKRRIAEAGLDPAEFSAHGLRSGYLTEAGRHGIPLLDAMQQSLHRSVSQASHYYNDAERKLGRAARLVV
ncbi:tyrosine-type recombinase/integrase [Aminobacter anthyllidis]|uniref:Tyrosine-type recombinase/integrase n=1 Tax=Aminobacter anthyllidis TaxID=1035067 RepID=A0A9X1D6H4_9HYPH|nr:site-specific integrase [Aminobacter anthyllidis]MBT1156799.1 tyrosine-type recombinase/integrase [Aminobacter anthyllidis]